ncbi:MAG: hypothetical protein HQ541_09255 [Mariniphaga sp.]|nr:hypothetical protein [Mariniphaga sp.]
MLFYPMKTEQDAIRMGGHFEKAYTVCKEMGFSYSARTSWPVDVLVKPIKPNKDGSITVGFYSCWGSKNMTDEILKSVINKGNFTINADILSDDLKLRVTCGHEFLHLIQNLYEFSSSWIEPEQGWLKEATAVWIEEKFANMPNYVSSSHNKQSNNLLRGWQRSSVGYVKNGYQLSPIFKDIADRYGDDEIIKVFNKIKDGILPSNAEDPVKAVISVVKEWEPVQSFWHGVLSSYLLGKYYNNSVNYEFLGNSSNFGSDLVLHPDDPKVEHTLTLVDFSGMLFKFDPRNFSSLTTVPLSLKVYDPTNCGILVCKYKKGVEITSVGEAFPGGNGQVIISDVKSIFDDGYELVLLVSNGKYDESKNYYGTNTVKLEVEFLNPEIIVDFAYFFNNADFVFNYNDGRSPLYENGVGHEFFLRHFVEPDVSNPNIYKANINFSQYSSNYVGTLSVEVINEPRQCLNFELNLDVTEFTYYKHHYRFNCDSIPFSGTIADTNIDSYWVWGNDFGYVIANYSYSQDTPSGEKKLTGYTIVDQDNFLIEISRK